MLMRTLTLEFMVMRVVDYKTGVFSRTDNSICSPGPALIEFGLLGRDLIFPSVICAELQG